MAAPGTHANLDQIFKRHSRPQDAITPSNKQAVAARRSRLIHVSSSPSWTPRSSSECTSSSKPGSVRSDLSTSAVERQWVDYVQLGTFMQGTSAFIVCTERRDKSSLWMFEEASEHRERMMAFSHPSLLTPMIIITTAGSGHMGFPYVRFTLEEILSVHRKLEEYHVHTIARSLFQGLQYLYEQGMAHTAVSPRSTRVCGRSGKVFLGDCASCTDDKLSENAIRDLEDLGLLLLRCMETSSEADHVRTAEDVRKHLSLNQVFGLAQPERWSGQSQLIDFINDLFTAHRAASKKYKSPHKYVLEPEKWSGALIPLAELASLECFTIWRPV